MRAAPRGRRRVAAIGGERGEGDAEKRAEKSAEKSAENAEKPDIEVVQKQHR
jgi:hypothetical protein